MNTTVFSPNDVKTLIVVGNGMVGHHCVEQLIAGGALERYRIHVFGEEAQRAYDRVHLSEYFTGRDAESLAMSEMAVYERPGLTLHLGVPVLEIDRDRHEIITSEGCFSYDKLILATGSYPFVPPIEGTHGNSRLVYRTLEDLDNIRYAASKAKRGVVVGGGLLHGGAALKARIEALGVGVHLSRATQSISDGKQYRYRMNFANDEFLETDLIVFSAGIRPQDGAGPQCELQLGPRGGIAIDEHCRTSDTDIYAIGECAAWNGSVFGLVAPGYQMARGVAAQLCEKDTEPFFGADMSTKLKLLGHGALAGAVSYRYIDEATASYRRLVVSADGKQVLGAVLVGDNSYYDTLLQYAHPATTSARARSARPSTMAAAIWPGSRPAPRQPPVAAVELMARGVAVDKSLCEHFAYTRQELYSMVRVEGIESSR